MNYFTKIDTFLIERVYQPIVDLSERQPRWLAEQCAWGMIAGCAVRAGLRPTNELSTWVLLAMALVVAVWLLFVARSGFTFSVVRGFTWWRAFLVVFLPIDLLHLTLQPSALGATRLFDTLLSLSYVYLACCQPPRPREPGRRAAAGGAA